MYQNSKDTSHGKQAIHAVPTPGQEISPSNLGSQRMNLNTTPNVPSSSGPGPSHASGFQVASDGPHYCNFSQLGPPHVPPTFVDALQHAIPLVQGNLGHNPCNTAAGPSSCQGGGFSMPPYGQPTAQNAAQSGQAGNPGASLHVGGQPPAAMACPNHYWPPEVLAKANARGVPGPLWDIFDVAVDHECGGDLRVIIHFKKNTRFS